VLFLSEYDGEAIMTTTASSISTSSSFSPNDLDFNLDLEQKIKAATEGFLPTTQSSC
jgi:hypothetical protein